MSDKNQTNQNDFIVEKIKVRPINRRKLIRRTLLTAAMAVIFGLIACFTFLVLEPIISKWLYPEEKPQIVVFPEDQEEMLPEEMLAENMPTEAPVMEPEEMPVVELEDEQIEEILSRVVMDKQNYVELYSAMSDYVRQLNNYLVTVTSITSNLDWFNNVQEQKNQTSGLIITRNGKELLVLADASLIKNAESIILTLYNNTHLEAQIKKIDPYTNLAVLSVELDKVYSVIKEENLLFPELGSINSIQLLGMPVVAVGSPMGISKSIGYGMITADNTIYSVPERNYRIIQTDINGSQNASGVLFNLQGQVVGIITGNKTGTDMKNMINAYGISDLKRIMEKLSNEEEIAYIGISGVNVTSEASGELGIPLGAFVKEVKMDSPAMLAGIQKGDVVVSIDGRNISTFNDYSKIMMQLEPGEKVELTVKRKALDEYKEMVFTIESREVK